MALDSATKSTTDELLLGIVRVTRLICIAQCLGALAYFAHVFFWPNVMRNAKQEPPIWITIAMSALPIVAAPIVRSKVARSVRRHVVSSWLSPFPMTPEAAIKKVLGGKQTGAITHMGMCEGPAFFCLFLFHTTRDHFALLLALLHVSAIALFFPRVSEWRRWLATQMNLIEAEIEKARAQEAATGY